MAEQKGIPTKDIVRIQKSITDSLSDCLKDLNFVNEDNKSTVQSIINFYGAVLSGCLMGAVVSEKPLNDCKAIALSLVTSLALCKHNKELNDAFVTLIHTLPVEKVLQNCEIYKTAKNTITKKEVLQ